MVPVISMKPAPAAEPDAPEAFRWPIPPFHQRVAGAHDGRGQQCVVEFMDGATLAGELVAVDAGLDSASLRSHRRKATRALDLGKVRMIRLNESPAFVPDQGMIQRLDASDSCVGSKKPYNVSFHDGRSLSGETRGFLKSPGGLFLFPIGAGETPAATWFIPRRQIKSAQIGPLLGEALLGKGLVSTGALGAALGEQTGQRQQRLGEYLADRAIVSPAKLTHALREQGARPNVRLGELLLETGVITLQELEDAVRVQAANRQRRLGDILVSSGHVTLRMIQVALADKLGIPYVNVREFPADPFALDQITAEFAQKHQVLPLLRSDSSLVVAVENPLALDFEQELQFSSGLTLMPVIGDPAEIRARIAKEYAPGNGVGAPSMQGRPRDLSRIRLEELTEQLAREAPQAGNAEAGEPGAVSSDNALVRLINKIIIDAHARGASDVHIETNAGDDFTRIRFRQDGELVDYLELQPAYRNALVSRIKVMASLDISEHRHAQDGKIEFRHFGPLDVELRVAVVPTNNGLEDVVLRILGGVEPVPMERLGLSPRDLEEVRKIQARSYGLFVVCGPTGSGKTTTLHAVLKHINRTDLKIWTAEDPVEITQAGLRQVQVNPKVGWTFANAMRAFLRADPDVIMVGEMRDAETVGVAVEASLTGHLVMSTLHTNSAAESVVRLLELGMDPFNFADSLLGILSQRLARKLCPQCCKAHALSEVELAALADEYCAGTADDPAAVLSQWRQKWGRDGAVTLYEAVGCESCRGGYRGRIGVYELLVASPEVKQLVRTRGTVPQLVRSAIAGGMRTLKQDAIDKVLQGLLDLHTARGASS